MNSEENFDFSASEDHLLNSLIDKSVFISQIRNFDKNTKTEDTATLLLTFLKGFTDLFTKTVIVNYTQINTRISIVKVNNFTSPEFLRMHFHTVINNFLKHLNLYIENFSNEESITVINYIISSHNCTFPEIKVKGKPNEFDYNIPVFKNSYYTYEDNAITPEKNILEDILLAYQPFINEINLLNNYLLVWLKQIKLSIGTDLEISSKFSELKLKLNISIDGIAYLHYLLYSNEFIETKKHKNEIYKFIQNSYLSKDKNLHEINSFDSIKNKVENPSKEGIKEIYNLLKKLTKISATDLAFQNITKK